MIVRWRKDQNYFIIRVYQDLVGDWIVTQCWGHSAREDDGSVCHTVAQSYRDARDLARQLNEKQRIKGFIEIRNREEQLGLSFD